VLFVPALDEAQRAVVGYYREGTDRILVGINKEVVGGWRPDRYGPWWWLFTVPAVRGILEAAGLRVLETNVAGDDRLGLGPAYFLARKR
jgi:hypothetical protein